MSIKNVFNRYFNACDFSIVSRNGMQLRLNSHYKSISRAGMNSFKESLQLSMLIFIYRLQVLSISLEIHCKSNAMNLKKGKNFNIKFTNFISYFEINRE